MESEGARPSGSVIRVEGVSHVYGGGAHALRGISLEIGNGLFGLLGPNGAGKSTLMRVLCTLLVPTQGRASVLGHDVVGERAAVRASIGYLPQEFGAWRLHRVEEVLDTLAALSGVPDADRRERVSQVLKMVGLEEVAHRKVKALSGGMVRRLGVAQALIHSPDVLVVDEPTVGLDPEERIRFRELMAELGEQKTVVLSTHIVADLGTACRDLALLDAGEVVFHGSPTELLQRAEGRVFECRTGADGAEQLGADVEIVSRSSEGDGLRIRGVTGQEGLPAGAAAVEKPTLEEAYLAFMMSRGRKGVALESGEDAA
jgi:ABC-type multidrug transport system ATPase subunit